MRDELIAARRLAALTLLLAAVYVGGLLGVSVIRTLNAGNPLDAVNKAVKVK